MSKVFVSVGVIIKDDKALLAKRHDHQHQGGLWEFPGGKVEPGETPFEALKRELKEEVNLDIHAATQVMTIDHHYPDKSVQLLIFRVTDFSGEAKHCEGQDMRWVSFDDLASLPIPEANKKIMNDSSLFERHNGG